MTPDSDKAQLLHQLRIDRSEREETAAGHGKWWLLARYRRGGDRRGGGAAGYAQQRHRGERGDRGGRTAGAAPTAILQATGYDSAEREATVSSEIAGQVPTCTSKGGRARSPRSGAGATGRHRQARRFGPGQAEFGRRGAVARDQAQLAQARRDFAWNRRRSVSIWCRSTFRDRRNEAGTPPRRCRRSSARSPWSGAGAHAAQASGG